MLLENKCLCCKKDNSLFAFKEVIQEIDCWFIECTECKWNSFKKESMIYSSKEAIEKDGYIFKNQRLNFAKKEDLKNGKPESKAKYGIGMIKNN